MKTSELTGPALDWAVAKCEGVEVEYINDGITRCVLRVTPFTGMYRPSTDWAQGGPIIEREGLTVRHMGEDFCSEWLARKGDGHWEGDWVGGPTPLIAACRCYVTSKLGDNIEVPEDLL